MFPPIVDVALLTITQPHKAVAEASTIGLKPGTFPREIIVQDDEGRSVILLRGQGVANAEREFVAVNYQSRDKRCTLTVYND